MMYRREVAGGGSSEGREACRKKHLGARESHQRSPASQGEHVVGSECKEQIRKHREAAD